MSNYLSYVSRDSTNSIQGYSCESYPKPGAILPENLSVKQEPKVTYIREQKYIFISSSHRNTTSYPKHYDYRIKFEKKKDYSVFFYKIFYEMMMILIDYIIMLLLCTNF